jgi:hypothetical protein
MPSRSLAKANELPLARGIRKNSPGTEISRTFGPLVSRVLR